MESGDLHQKPALAKLSISIPSVRACQATLALCGLMLCNTAHWLELPYISLRVPYQAGELPTEPTPPYWFCWFFPAPPQQNRSVSARVGSLGRGARAAPAALPAWQAGTGAPRPCAATATALVNAWRSWIALFVCEQKT